MKKALSVILAVFLAGLFAGCAGVVAGSGKQVTEAYDFAGFTRLEVGSTFELVVTRSASYSVSVTADDNLFQYIEVSQDGETLKIGLKSIIRLGPATLKAQVGMPLIRGLELSGASKGTLSGFSSQEEMDITVSGASSLELVDMTTGDLKLDVSGASRLNGSAAGGDADFEVSGASIVQLEGSAGNLVADASGASRIMLAAFTVANADVTLSGASSGTVNIRVGGRLDADLSGASRLEYIGEQINLGSIHKSGASTLSKK